MSKQSRLQWRCRRGIKEMDLVCQRFLEQEYPRISDEERRLFDQILDESDLDILDWILDRSRPRRSEYQPLIDRFRQLKPE